MQDGYLPTVPNVQQLRTAAADSAGNQQQRGVGIECQMEARITSCREKSTEYLRAEQNRRFTWQLNGRCDNGVRHIGQIEHHQLPMVQAGVGKRRMDHDITRIIQCACGIFGWCNVSNRDTPADIDLQSTRTRYFDCGELLRRGSVAHVVKNKVRPRITNNNHSLVEKGMRSLRAFSQGRHVCNQRRFARTKAYLQTALSSGSLEEAPQFRRLRLQANTQRTPTNRCLACPMEPWDTAVQVRQAYRWQLQVCFRPAQECFRQTNATALPVSS